MFDTIDSITDRLHKIAVKLRQSGNMEQYYKSKHWRAFTARAKKHYNYECMGCGKKSKTLHVHHRHYRNIGREQYDDVTIYCSECHSKQHADRKKRK